MEININRGVEDAFYRYKMPKLQAKVEGKGNGIKTVIVNATDIANSLSRKPIYVTKYFGCELGAQVNVDEKNERYIVNGAHDASKLQKILDGFIKKFVLCQACGNPETVLSVKRKTEVKTKCKACGASGQLDSTHRLTQYIIKNPPGDDVCKKTDKKQDSDEDKQISFTPDGNELVAKNNEDFEDWGEECSEAAQKARIEELSIMAQTMAMSTDIDKTSREKVHIFLRYIIKHRENDTLISNCREIILEANKLDLDTKALLIFIEGALSNPLTVVEDIKNYSEIFRLLIKECGSRKKSEYSVLCGIVLLIGLNSEVLLKKSPVILKCIYDEDIVSEDSILAWSEPSFKLPSGILNKKVIKEYEKWLPHVLKKSEIFIVWLKEAEEESSEEEEIDSVVDQDSEPDKESFQSGDNPKVSEKNVGNVMPESDDELDIDAI